jgi:hypothetical protein
MSTESLTQTGRYVYAFARNSDVKSLLSDAPQGLGDASLEVIGDGAISAITSPTDESKVRPQRKNLAAHQTVVGWLTERSSILPVAFGLIADDAESVEKLLSVHEEVLTEQIARVDGCVEMSLTLRWSVENVFQYFVSQSEELQIASQKIAQGEATRDEQIEMGRQFEALLSAERQSHTDRVTEELESVLVESDQQAERDEFDIVRLACLIERENVEKFSAEVYRIAESFNEDFAFAFNGPWAPYSFVNLSLSFN